MTVKDVRETIQEAEISKCKLIAKANMLSTEEQADEELVKVLDLGRVTIARLIEILDSIDVVNGDVRRRPFP